MGFVDCVQPTTGLSSAGALALMRHLKRMAQVLNITVIMTIHQPSRRAYECLDSVVLLAQGGVCAYAGLRRDTPDWLAAHHLHLPNEMSPAEGIVAAVTRTLCCGVCFASACVWLCCRGMGSYVGVVCLRCP